MKYGVKWLPYKYKCTNVVLNVDLNADSHLKHDIEKYGITTSDGWCFKTIEWFTCVSILLKMGKR